LLLRPESWLARALSLPVPRFFGEISYTIYLVHRPLLLAMTGILATYPGFVAMPAVLRFVLVSAALLVLTTLVSWVLYVTVERPGNRLGHRLTLNQTSAAVQSGQQAN
jgi:peptidoglycan/LPS O-acetylase OafA/YrhL